MIHIREIDHVVLRVSRLDVMLHFYIDVLGLVRERFDEELGLYQLRAGRALIDLITTDGRLGRAGGEAPGRDRHNMDHLCLRVDPFDEASLTLHLRRHGIDPGNVVERYGAQGMGPSFYITDPEGNTIELKGPASVPLAKDALP